MASRCPSCGAEVPEDCEQCLACAWDSVVSKTAEPDPAALEGAESAPEEPEAPRPLQTAAAKNSADAPIMWDLSPKSSLNTPPPVPEEIERTAAPPSEAERYKVMRLVVVLGLGIVLAVLTANLLMLRPSVEPPPAASKFEPAAASPQVENSQWVAPGSKQRVTFEMPAELSPARPAPPAANAPAQNEPKAAPWVFHGVAYDLLTAKGVFAAKLVFTDAEGQVYGTVETDEYGRYRVALPERPEKGYSLRIVHDDYSGKHIDEADSTGALRKADLAQRKLLMRSRVRNPPWIGAVGRSSRRDLGLVPRSEDEP